MIRSSKLKQLIKNSSNNFLEFSLKKQNKNNLRLEILAYEVVFYY